MPAALVKILALSGVISAGCFAVWKANSDLAPAGTPGSSEFTQLDGEPGDTIGLGGEPIPKSKMAADSGSSTGDADDTSAMAMAEFDFAKESGEESPSTAGEMPAAFPAGDQSEPETDPTPAAPGLFSEETAPEPGVASLEALESAEQEQTAEPPIRTASSEMGAAPPGPVLKQLPSRSGGPALLPTPAATGNGRTRTPSPTRIVPANAESVDLQADQNAEPAVDTGIEILPQEIGENAASEPAPRLPEIRSRGSVPASTAPQAGEMLITPAGRARGSSIPARTPPAKATDEPPVSPGDESIENPFPAVDSSIPEGIGAPAQQSEPEATQETENPFAPRTRTSIPTPSQAEEPAAVRSRVPEPTALPIEPGQFSPPPGEQPTRTPTTNHAVGESVVPGQHSAKSSIPSKPLSENLLIGDATIDDPAITPSLQPQVRVEKKAQSEVEIGQRMVYEIIVQNVGQVPAHAVVVEERIPKGSRMERSQPQAKLSRDKTLHWDLGTLPAGSQKVIKVEVTPLEAGPIGSVATVRFAAQVATKTVVTAPTLSLEVEHPQEVAMGELVPIHFVVTNKGTATARNVKLSTLFHENGLQHVKGRHLDKVIGTLAPGQSQRIDLKVTAAEEGRFAPTVVLTANEVEQENRTLDLNVIKSRLTLSREGHARRFVNRPAEFSTRVANHSIEVMKDVHIVETLPPGVIPVGEMSKYRWNAKTRTVEWTVSQLGPGQYSDLKLNVVADRAGELQGKIEAVAANGQRAELPTMLEVQGFPALKVDIHGDDKPVAVDEQVSMRVTVSNQGSAAATSVQAMFELPPELKLVGAEGPAKFTQDGNMVTFAALEELAPSEKKTYDIVLTAAQEGSSKVAVDVYSDDRKTDPVRQEEAVTIIPK